MIYVYESAEGDRLTVAHEDGAAPPQAIREAGRDYVLSYQAYDPSTDSLGLGVVVAAPVRPSLRDGRVESYQLPRFDANHKGEFSPDGKPRFSSRNEAREYARRTTGETGIDTRYGEL